MSGVRVPPPASASHGQIRAVEPQARGIAVAVSDPNEPPQTPNGLTRTVPGGDTQTGRARGRMANWRKSKVPASTSRIRSAAPPSLALARGVDASCRGADDDGIRGDVAGSLRNATRRCSPDRLQRGDRPGVLLRPRRNANDRAWRSGPREPLSTPPELDRTFGSMAEQRTTTASRVRVSSHEHSLGVGPNGPTALQDTYAVERMPGFVRFSSVADDGIPVAEHPLEGAHHD